MLMEQIEGGHIHFYDTWDTEDTGHVTIAVADAGFLEGGFWFTIARKANAKKFEAMLTQFSSI